MPEHLYFRGEPVRCRPVRNAECIRLQRDAKGHWLLTVPLGAPKDAAVQFLSAYMGQVPSRPGPPQNPGPVRMEGFLAHLRGAAELYCHRLDVPVPEILLFRSHKLWGNCRQLPPQVRLHEQLIDYPSDIVAEALLHELCHLRVPDHSPAFWQLLTQLMPDWPKREGILRSYQPKSFS